MKPKVLIVEDEPKQPEPAAVAALTRSAIRLHIELTYEESHWLRSMNTNQWSRREMDVAHAAFVEGWYRRCGEDPNLTDALGIDRTLKPANVAGPAGASAPTSQNAEVSGQPPGE
jgi:hypothetical protein